MKRRRDGDFPGRGDTVLKGSAKARHRAGWEEALGIWLGWHLGCGWGWILRAVSRLRMVDFIPRAVRGLEGF